MKVCMCRDFCCAATREAIETYKPERAEEVHWMVKGEPPKCGRCLSLIDAMRERYEKDGIVPRPLDVTREEQNAAERRLGERYSREETGNDKPPSYKRLYIQMFERT